MAEPMPLGQRIAEAAAGCIVAEIDHGAGSPEAVEVWAELLTLCDRADAAGRLAKAADALGWTDAADYMEGATEFKAALDEWREVGE